MVHVDFEFISLFVCLLAYNSEKGPRLRPWSRRGCGDLATDMSYQFRWPRMCVLCRGRGSALITDSNAQDGSKERQGSSTSGGALTEPFIKHSSSECLQTGAIIQHSRHSTDHHHMYQGLVKGFIFSEW